MSQLVIGVTGINASDNPAPGIGVAKSLKLDTDLDARIVGLAYDAMEPGIYMDWFIDKAFMVPYPTAGHEALVARLLYIKATYGLDVVVPTLDSELPFYIQARDELEQIGILTYLPDKKQLSLRDKQSLPRLAALAGVEVPGQAIVTNHAELTHAVQQLGLPVMVKGPLYSAHKAYTQQEAMAHFSTVVAKWGYPVIIQKVIQGDELNVIGVGDGEGNDLGLVAIKKMNVTGLGKIWTGVTVNHGELLEATRRFVKATRWRGAFEMECILSNNQVNLIEINPRFPAWVYFATGVGVNLPAALVRQAIGSAVSPSETYPAGQLYVRYTDERVCDMALFQNMVTQGESL